MHATMTRIRPAFVYALLGAVILLGVQSYCASVPTGPSRDSLEVAAWRQWLGRERARSQAVSDSNRALGARLLVRADSTRKAVRQEQKHAQPAPPDSAVTALDYWQARAKAAEVLLDLTVAADSIVQDSLGRALTRQIAETARLAQVVAAVQDSLGKVEIRFGQLSRQLAKARRPCTVGDVAGGWDPLHGGAALVVGASCNVWRLVRRG